MKCFLRDDESLRREMKQQEMKRRRGRYRKRRSAGDKKTTIVRKVKMEPSGRGGIDT